MGYDMKSGNVLFNFKTYDVTYKAWGEERLLVRNELYTSKLMLVNPMFQCSLHKHNNKHETFVCLCGVGFIEKEKDGKLISVTFSPGTRMTIDRGEYHRFGSRAGMVLLETSTKDDSNDCERKEPSKKMEYDDENTL